MRYKKVVNRNKIIAVLLLAATTAKAQRTTESFSFHTQNTVITQYKPAFSAAYTGDNSLIPQEENQLSITSSWYAGAKLWKWSSLFINPELAGGSGLSGAFGVANSTNGETFRVGSPDPKLYLARLFFRQLIALKPTATYQSSDYNQLAGNIPTHYLAATIGKIEVADYFDNNSYAHDPRSQFMSWGLMANGAWDYPANTRGYTPGVILEYVTPTHELRYGVSLVPLMANGSEMDWKVNKASSHALEYTRRYSFKGQPGAIRLLGYLTTANMGNYNQSVTLNPIAPDITATRKYGNTKYGFGINMEQALSADAGVFMRAGWNDGNNETWTFTEVDRTISAGVSIGGNKWKRSADRVGLAYVASGISAAHRNYLQAGGKGFMLGDGNLNYGWEQLTELYYSAEVFKNSVYLSGTYQFLLNPGYNMDRGPAHIFSVRMHAKI